MPEYLGSISMLTSFLSVVLDLCGFFQPQGSLCSPDVERSRTDRCQHKLMRKYQSRNINTFVSFMKMVMPLELWTATVHMEYRITSS
jgi:hypothetical protein